ncbi:MAG TPA: hypothetical protein DCE02_06165 [Ruminiclostridium sp.]|jgi:rubrerythrin|uniref:DUF2383 domain-containing protein n=1 Tax=Acetivibrio saccincola TaxID=1677857 RepID=A0A2K9EHI6_9FIRM|nr:hypothetical protein [Acetivibrio saccincola]HAA43568.1 hypothetical protein [Ruminiclostridium sp.]AUG58675.1 hypothetical protein HVS_14070 [Acetivibrio saccincola]NLW26400.1 hypothetical protein [Acetivibrio saccincola]PQQ66218.1 hypothetical protein B9R14_05265 [Acetivibrio saccincola]HOA98023.1 hypothetical protein [Acetivibrio saccincola]
MDKLSQEYMLNIMFNESIDREQLLLKKYDDIFDKIKDKEIKNMLKEFSKNSREHIDILKDKMIALNIKKT